MDFEYICEFDNLAYGKCYLIDKKENKYLVYSPFGYLKSYIVCSYMDDMGTMVGQNFFETLDEAKAFFNKEASKEKKLR